MEQSKRPLEPGKKAMVVGASTGIGAALVQELGRRGWLVAAVARREKELVDVCAIAGALPFVHDVTHYGEVPALFQQITKSLDGLDLIVYVAGVMPPVAVDEFNFAKDQPTIEVNVLGAMAWLDQAAVRFTRQRGGQIVGIGSIAGDRGRRGMPAYHASKAALHTYLESLRNRLSQHGVIVTTIKPGMVETAMLQDVAKKMWPISAESAAQQIVQAIEKKKQTVYVPARWRWVSLVIRHLPSFIFRRLNF